MNDKTADLQDLRIDLARRSAWNIGFFVAGLLLWIGILVTNLTTPIETGRMVWIALTFGVFPIAVLVSRLIRADPFCNDNPLGQLVGYSHMSVVSLSFPIFIIAAIYDPHIQLLAMAILLSIDFYVMSWAFGSPVFGLHAAARTVLVTLMWAVFPESRLTLIPMVVATFYLGTVISLPILRRRWLEQATK
ncbi:MAG: hypothetical protein QNJ19_15805 [Woeseiaceae bacterium]|nr:hypothetical protein [Woeseiaceae bacterium]